MSDRTVGALLERDRLAARAARLNLVLAVLDARAAARIVQDGAPPPRLHRAITAFHHELAEVRDALATQQRTWPPPTA
jgi:hypothetical protein